MTKEEKRLLPARTRKRLEAEEKRRRIKAKAARKQKRPEDEEKRQLIKQAQKIVPSIDKNAMLKYDIKTLKQRLDMAVMKQCGLFYSTRKGAKKVISTPMK